MASFQRQSPEQQTLNQQRLKRIMQLPGNDECMDCQARNPTWACFNMGFFICMRCSGLHRCLGVHISKVKSCTMDLWDEAQIDFMEQVGNTRAKVVWEALLPPRYVKPGAREATSLVLQWIRDKYQLRKYVKLPENYQTPEQYFHVSTQQRRQQKQEQQQHQEKAQQNHHHVSPSVPARRHTSVSSPPRLQTSQCASPQRREPVVKTLSKAMSKEIIARDDKMARIQIWLSNTCDPAHGDPVEPQENVVADASPADEQAALSAFAAEAARPHPDPPPVLLTSIEKREGEEQEESEEEDEEMSDFPNDSRGEDQKRHHHHRHHHCARHRHRRHSSIPRQSASWRRSSQPSSSAVPSASQNEGNETSDKGVFASLQGRAAKHLQRHSSCSINQTKGRTRRESILSSVPSSTHISADGYHHHREDFTGSGTVEAKDAQLPSLVSKDLVQRVFQPVRPPPLDERPRHRSFRVLISPPFDSGDGTDESEVGPSANNASAPHHSTTTNDESRAMVYVRDSDGNHPRRGSHHQSFIAAVRQQQQQSSVQENSMTTEELAAAKLRLEENLRNI